MRGLKYAAAVVAAGAGGAAATGRSVASWYPSLRKPAWAAYAAALKVEIWRQNRS